MDLSISQQKRPITRMENLKIPNLLLLGAQKSASTYLGTWIGNHPEIHVKSKEDYSLEDPEYENFDLNSLKLKTPKKYYAIRRPDYFGNIKYQERVHRTFPEAKIIIVLRYPVNRAYSAYYHYMKYGIIPVKHPNYIYNIIEGNHDKQYGAYENVLKYGEYYKLITHLLKFYKKESILILKQEEINKDETFLKVAEFLKISKEVPNRPEIIPQRSIYNLRKLKIKSFYLPFKNKYDSKRTKAYTLKYEELNILKKTFIKSIHKIEKIFYGSSKKKEVINNELKLALFTYYKEDIKKLNNLNLIDVSNWLERPSLKEVSELDN